LPPDAADTDDDKAKPRIAFYTNAGGIDETRGWLRDPVNRGLRQVQLAQLGVPPERREPLLQGVGIEPVSLLTRDPKTGELHEAKKKDEIQEFVAPFGLVMLLTMIVMVGAAPMLSAVTEDKNQRIFEMLLGLATPTELMASRVLAALGRSLTSSVFYIAGAVFVLQGMSMLGVVPFGLLPWFFVYLIAHVTMLCTFAAALGAACSSPQEAQNLAVVLVAPIMIPFFLLMPVMQSPNGTLATVMSLIPPFTPPMMLLRQALPAGVNAPAPGQSLSDMLIAGELEAIYSPPRPQAYHPERGAIVRLFPDFRKIEQEYFRKTGAFPPQHLIVVRREVWEANRWIARSLTDAFIAANDCFSAAQTGFPYATPWLEAELEDTAAVMGDDFHPYGLERNRDQIEMFAAEAFRLGLTRRQVTPEEYFADYLQAG